MEFAPGHAQSQLPVYISVHFPPPPHTSLTPRQSRAIATPTSKTYTGPIVQKPLKSQSMVSASEKSSTHSQSRKAFLPSFLPHTRGCMMREGEGTH